MPNPTPADAKHGEKMISVNLRFWTGNIANEKGKILPGHAWTSGTMRLEANQSHGIPSGTTEPFNSLMEIPAVLEQLFIQNGMVLHVGGKTGKYIAAAPAHSSPSVVE